MSVSRRQFFTTAFIGLLPKSRRSIAGTFVNESVAVGHQLRDRAAFPKPGETRRVPLVIVGGGIAGLSAGWRLLKRGVRDFALLEMEADAGGNARWGRNEVSAFPWGAHYVPVPGRSLGLVRELFEDLGLFDGERFDERHLVHAPRERLFIHGRWQEGLEPSVGPTDRDRDQIARFEDRMIALAATGRFQVPMDAARSGPDDAVEDALSMAAWLDRNRFDSPWLRWMVDYACRDDYGALAADVSAWAGIHYFAAREADDNGDGPLTWPEGNGRIVRLLVDRLGPMVHTGAPAYRIERRGAKWHVLTPQTEWITDAVIVATPLLVASRIVDDMPPADLVYSPWITANLTLDRWPRERGIGPAWDNVLFDSPALGYVVATHQALRVHVPQTVWTYYWALAGDTPTAARRWLLGQDWSALKDRIVADLSRAHPDLSECVTRIDIMRFGHAMVRPTPGFLASPLRKPLLHGRDGLFFAHSDVSGLPLFEEAQYRGVAAADQAMAALGGAR
jgi:glycine/D-amino acid oxidase-like deaminating enzyme